MPGEDHERVSGRQSMTESNDILDNQIRISDLYHLYGELLSERQRTFIELYYDENLSLSEIAARHGISRQAVHDAIKHGRRALSRYETVMGLLDSRDQRPASPTPSEWRGKASVILDEMEITIDETLNGDSSRLKAQIASLRDLLKEASGQSLVGAYSASNGESLT